jgi:hypothetical protein
MKRFHLRRAPQLRRRRVAEFLQALAALLPGGGVEDADGRQFIHFETGNPWEQRMIRSGSP